MSDPNDAAPGGDGDLQRYLQPARQLYEGVLSEEELPARAAALPLLTHSLLQQLVALAREQELQRPRFGWALLAVAVAAAGSPEPQGGLAADRLRLQSLASWQLARAAQAWARPLRAARAAAAARRGFTALQEPGWIAACRWLEHAPAWTRPDFRQAQAALAEALQGLQNAGMDDLVPLCRRDLAYAQILNEFYDEASANLDQAERAFRAREDRPNLAYLLLDRATLLARLGRGEEALALVDQAQALLTLHEAPAVWARARYRRGQVYAILNRSFALQEAELEAALALFRQLDQPLWAGQALNLLAHVYRFQGELEAARQALQEAGAIFEDYELRGLRADNLLDRGKAAQARGDYRRAVDLYRQAESLYQTLQLAVMAAIARLYRAQAYVGLGRFQEALRQLEAARPPLQPLQRRDRLAECDLALAAVWLELDEPQQALQRLQLVESYWSALPLTFRADVTMARAEALLRQEAPEQAAQLLQQRLAESGDELPRAQQGLLQRFLGAALARQGDLAAGCALLQEVVAAFQRMEMAGEAARTLVELGRCQRQRGQRAEAASAWQEALALGGDSLPDVAWRAHGGLAGLAEEAGDEGAALAAYGATLAALGRLRRRLWQPVLAGSYLAQPAPVLDSAVALAARTAAPARALHFVEESKAQTTARQLALLAAAPSHSEGEPEALRALAAEIQWLREQIAASQAAHPGWLRPPQERQWRQQQQQREQAYDRLAGQLERARWGDAGAELPAAGFDLARFRQQAGRALGEDGAWLALDCYLTSEALHLVLVTPGDCRLVTRPRLPAHDEALRALARKGDPPQRDSAALAALAGWLLPPALRRQLQPETILFIAPHRTLHRLSWPALLLGDERSLVDVAVPVVVPSLATLSALWQRAPAAGTVEEQPGLLLAISRFASARRPLPAVQEEAQRLLQQVATSSRPAAVVLRDEEATWSRLQALSGEEGLARFAFWHIASHAFHNAHTGRLSGLALYDRDISLDALWRCAPLPPLVTLSACSGSRSRVYAGDEHTGLATTCLAAGAQAVVGSLWPVPDEAAAALMDRFYRHYLAGAPPAVALARAQRAAAADGLSPAAWGGFLCIGAPV